MHLTVVQAGRLRDTHILALREEYLTRFRRFGSLRVVEKEPKAGQALWPERTIWRILVCERGEQVESPELAKRLATWSMHHGDIAFAIGDAHGHDAHTAATATWRWSLGKLVLPHALAHLVVIEQLYRAATIQAGLPYHHT